MGDYYSVKLNLELIRARLSESLAKPVSADEVMTMLNEEGFSRDQDSWVIKATDFSMLQADEILSARSLDDGVELDDIIAAPQLRSAEAPRPAWRKLEMIRRLEALPDSDQCLIPDFLTGNYRSVVSKSRTVIRNLIKSQEWSVALKKAKFTPVMDLDCRLIIDTGIGFAEATNDVMLFPFVTQFADVCGDMVNYATDRYFYYRQSYIEGLDYFWFCLCFCCHHNSPAMPMVPDHFKDDLKEASLEMLKKILSWWPYLCACETQFMYLDGRYDIISIPRPFYYPVGILGMNAGMSWDGERMSKMSLTEIGDYMRDWLDKMAK